MTAKAIPRAQRTSAETVGNADAAASELVWLHRLRLDGGVTWLARDGAGELRVVKRLDAGSEQAAERIVRSVRSAQRVDADALVPVVSVRMDGDRVWLHRVYDDGVALDRVLAIALAAPSQVAAIAEGLLTALTALHAARLAHGAVTAGNVVLSRDGRVRLTDAALAPRSAGVARAQSQRDDLAAAVALIRSLVRPGRPGSAPIRALLASRALDEAGSAAAAAQLVRAARGQPVDEPAARASLASLVARLGSPRPSEPVMPPAVSTEGVGEERVDVAREALTSALRRQGSRRRRRRLAAAAAVGVGLAAAAAVTAAVVLRTHHTAPRSSGVAGAHAPRPSSAGLPPSTASGAAAAALQPPAPAAASFISGASVSAAGACAPGAQCTLISRVDLGAHDGEAVTWQVVAVDACTGRVSPLYSASIELSPDYLYVYDQRAVTLPAGHPLELYTVSSRPVRVASPPLQVSTPGLSCAA